jgi:plasmid stability protein
MGETVTLTIRNVPLATVEQLKERAKRNHRSLQGELMAIVDNIATEAPTKKTITIAELAEQGRRLGLSTPPSEAVQMIREDRDSR